MDFSEFKKSKQKAAKDSGTEKPDKKQLNMLKNFLKSFEGKSEDEIYEAVLSVAKKNRDEGKLTDGDIDNFYAMLYPFIDDEKRKKLEAVIKRLKKL